MLKIVSAVAGLTAIAAAVFVGLPASGKMRIVAASTLKSDRGDAGIRCEFRDWPRHRDGCLQFHPNFDEPLVPTPVVVDEAFAWPAAMPDAPVSETMAEAPSGWPMSERELRLFIDASEVAGASS